MFRPLHVHLCNRANHWRLLPRVGTMRRANVSPLHVHSRIRANHWRLLPQVGAVRWANVSPLHGLRLVTCAGYLIEELLFLALHLAPMLRRLDLLQLVEHLAFLRCLHDFGGLLFLLQSDPVYGLLLIDDMVRERRENPCARRMTSGSPSASFSFIPNPNESERA